MRWVDIEQLNFPDGWQQNAENALNQLRIEINNAELNAQENQTDVATARRQAISDGLDQPKRKKIWRDLESELARLKNGKCWYSESPNSGSDKDIDHFRPKSRVAEDPNHEGYWWLAFNWNNYRYSCKRCNQRRNNQRHNDIENRTDGGKWDHFPISSNSFRAQRESDNWRLEEIDLLDPIDPDDWKLLTFLPNGQSTPTKLPDTREYHRARTSIHIYHLHHYELVRDRKALATKIRLLVEDMEILQPKITDPEMRILYKNQQKILLRSIHPNSEYSAAALAYAKAAIYKMEGEHQVTREWLRELLHSHP
jgi:uncharacterized protein (TIGR02646 family)